MAKKNGALVSRERQALIQQVMSNSLLTHHFNQCPDFRELFLEHLKGFRYTAKKWTGYARGR